MHYPAEYIYASLILLGPLALIAIWTDLRQMLIRNWTNGLFAAIALFLGIIFLGWPTIGLHIGFAVAVMG